MPSCWSRRRSEPLGDDPDEVRDAAAVAPLVVVPRDDLHEVAAQDHRACAVDDRRARVAAEVGAHKRLVTDAEDALHGAGRGGPEGRVELLDGRLALELGGEVDDGDGRGGDAEAEAVELDLEA